MHARRLSFIWMRTGSVGGTSFLEGVLGFSLLRFQLAVPSRTLMDRQTSRVRPRPPSRPPCPSLHSSCKYSINLTNRLGEHRLKSITSKVNSSSSSQQKNLRNLKPAYPRPCHLFSCTIFLATTSTSSQPFRECFSNLAWHWKRRKYPGGCLRYRHLWQSWSLQSSLRDESNLSFQVGFFVKMKEPTVFRIHMFSASAFTLKSFMIARLNWTMIQAVCFVFLRVKSFWFWWCTINIWQVNFAPFAHLSSRVSSCHNLSLQIAHCYDFHANLELWNTTSVWLRFA